MKIGVMGAGAVGCYYGAVLARAGHAVTLVGRSAMAERVQAIGLRLEMSDRSCVERVRASDDPALLAGSDIVIFSVKSGDTEEAARAVSRHIGGQSLVLSFQNGIENAARLHAILHGEVIPAAVYVAAEIVGPGHVKHNGRGDIILGSSSKSDWVAGVFRDAGIPTVISPDVMGALWSKLILNCAYNALSAVSQLPYGKIAQVQGVGDLMADVIAECLSVAAASGVPVADSIWSDVFALARAMPNQYSSTAQDIARKRPTEIDHLNGYIVRKGKELGIKTPSNNALYTMVKLLEAKQVLQAHDLPTL